MTPLFSEKQKSRLPSLASIATRATKQLSQRAVILTAIVCLALAVCGWFFVTSPLEEQFARFSQGTSTALSNRNQELVRSSVEQAANSMLRLLGSAETVTEELSSQLENPKRSAGRGSVPLERDFFKDGKWEGTLGTHDGYQSKVTFELPQLKPGDRSDIDRINKLWDGFLSAAKEFHSYHSELKWIYLGTNRGSFLVFPASPEIPRGYDPRTRSWYQEALAHQGVVWTTPYYTAGGNDLVLTVARPLKKGPLKGSVVGVDVVMSDVINNLLATPYCEHCTFYLLNQSGEILGKKGDRAVGDSWSNAPKARRLSDDLSSFVPKSVADAVVGDMLQSPTDSKSSLSRIPKAIVLPSGSTHFAFYSAPIEKLGWHLLGVAAQNDPGADGSKVLGAITTLARTTKDAAGILVLGILFSAAVLLWTYSLLTRAVLRRSLRPAIDQLTRLGTGLDQLTLDRLSDFSPSLSEDQSLSREYSAILEALHRMQQRLRRESEDREHFRAQAEVGTHARQVAHNMRSPLESLELTLPALKDVPEEKLRVLRTAIREIRDLANSVKAKGEQKPEQPRISSEKLTVPKMSLCLLSELVESTVSERRVAFQSVHLSLTDSFKEKAFGIFVSVNATEFRCVLSNIINNACEAVPNSGGSVTVDLSVEGGIATVAVIDNGKGISSDVLPKLGIDGATFGKENGTGLGLFHAKSTLEALGGKIIIQSSTGGGTQVSIQVPVRQAPAWFVPSLNISKDAEIAVIDDDRSIHAMWDLRLNAITKDPLKPIKHFHDAQDLRNWITRKHPRVNSLFLVDYDLNDESRTGLDLIEELDLAERSLLITASHDDPSVLSRAQWLGVRVIPKELLGVTPIVLQ